MLKIPARLFLAVFYLFSQFASSQTVSYIHGAAPLDQLDNTRDYALLTRKEFVPDPESDAGEMRLLKQRLRDNHFYECRRWEALPPEEALKTVLPDGGWPDIDISTGIRRGPDGFEAITHLRRLQKLVLAYFDSKHPLHQSPRVRDAVAQGVDYWIEKRPRSENSWWNIIGGPQHLLPILGLMEDQLGAERIARAMPVLLVDDLSGKPDGWSGGATGTNLIWIANINLQAALLAKDAFLVARAARRISQEIKLHEVEGIQPDWSFTQHGRMLYTVGYGSSYVSEILRAANLLADTRFALPADKLELCAGFLLEGFQWFKFGSHDLAASTGRGITRVPPAEQVSKPGAPGSSAPELMARLAPARAAELVHAGRRLRKDPEAEPLIGNRHFWRVDYMVHRRADWVASVKMASRRVAGVETGNGENLKGHHLADGVIELLVSGAEYHRIQPLWNWRQLPGTTVIQTTGKLPEHLWGQDASGTTDFVGGASDGSSGVAAFDFDRDHLRARKSWFFSDTGYVAIGTNITTDSRDSPEPVFTSVEQSWSLGRLVVFSPSGRRTYVDGDSLESEGPAVVWHSSAVPSKVGPSLGIAYRFDKGQKIRASLEKRSDTWKSVNDNLTDDPVVGQVFSLLIDHGTKPSDASYHYGVFPGVTEQGAQQLLSGANLNANPNLHAVTLKPEVFLIVFWEPGFFASGENRLEVDQACLAIIRDNAVILSDPSTKLKRIHLRWMNEGTLREQMVDLPQGLRAGQSVKIMWETPPTSALPADFARRKPGSELPPTKD